MSFWARLIWVAISEHSLSSTLCGILYPSGSTFRVNSAGALKSPFYFEDGTGRNPLGGLVMADDGTVFGTTVDSNTTGPTYTGYSTKQGGTVFRMNGDWVPTVLAYFSDITARYPRGNLVRDSDGSLWGTTTSSTGGNFGNVFKYTNAGLQVVYSFTGGMDGGRPLSGLVRGPDGNFYGSTATGGEFNGGTLFKLTSSETGGAVTTLASFSPQTGTAPGGSLGIAADGSIYGVTGITSSNEHDVSLSPGKIFKRSGDGSVSVLADPGTRFAGGLNSAETGSFIGAMRDGGTDGVGAIYQISPEDRFSIVAELIDNNLPVAGGLAAGSDDGKVFGTTIFGGKNGKGSLFEIAPDGTVTELARLLMTTSAFIPAVL